MPTLGTVSDVASTEAMPFDDTFKTAPLCNPDRINDVALGEDCGSDDIARLEFK